MRTTWNDAQDTLLEPTVIGWTQKSQDRIWLVASVDDVSTDEWYGSWLYHIKPGLSSYDLWDEELCFTSLRETRAYIAGLAENQREYWLPLNLGDDHRYEQSVLTGKTFEPKFAASKPIFEWKFRVLANRPAVLRKAGIR